jgi:hypothetical protein
VVRDRRPYLEPEDNRLGRANPGASSTGEAVWTRPLEEAKGTAAIRLADGSIHRAEVHWYEATGMGRREIKVKRYLNAIS